MKRIFYDDVFFFLFCSLFGIFCLRIEFMIVSKVEDLNGYYFSIKEEVFFCGSYFLFSFFWIIILCIKINYNCILVFDNYFFDRR